MENVKNGGQIWDFEAEDLKGVFEDVELKPLFVDASLKVQSLEAELCPAITEDHGGQGMEGATYSGGQAGKGLIQEDENSAAKASNGYFVHFLYVQGNTLTWKLNASAADTNVTLFARFGAEYGSYAEDYG